MMSPLPAHRESPFTPLEHLRFAREVLRAEGQAVLALADRVGGDFCAAIELLQACRGSVIVSGIGKAGHVGKKLSATFCSTGTRSHFLHPAEALHGDLGRVDDQDVALVLSFSGETEEIVRLLPLLARLGAPVVAVTANPASTLGRSAAVALDLGPLQEACSLGLAPSTSTTAMLALGDTLALTLSRARGFTAADFARFHPGGNLGRKLARVEDHMRPLHECRLADCAASVREAFVGQRRTGRRTGAVMLTDAAGRLAGIFTDSDLARLLERRQETAFDEPVSAVMTRNPQTVREGEPMSRAVSLLADRKISELPVVDDSGRPVGLIDITDVVALLPPEDAGALPAAGSNLPLHSTNSPARVEGGPRIFRSNLVAHRTGE